MFQITNSLGEIAMEMIRPSSSVAELCMFDSLRSTNELMVRILCHGAYFGDLTQEDICYQLSDLAGIRD